jgi:hypothetical protein
MESECLSTAYYNSLYESITSDEIAKEYKISEILKEEKYKTAIDEQNQFIRNSLMPSS